MNHTQIVAALQKEHAQRAQELSRIDTAIRALGELNGHHSKRSRLSVAARQRIAAAQRKRWAKWKKAKR